MSRLPWTKCLTLGPLCGLRARHRTTLFDMREDPVELVQAVVIHHELAFAGRGMLDGHLRAELVGELLLEAQDVRVASIVLSFGRVRRRAWRLHPADERFGVADR